MDKSSHAEGTGPSSPASPHAEGTIPSSAASPTEDIKLEPGTSVRLVDLKSAPHLNGLAGICEELNEATGRWNVRLESDEVKTVKPINLLPLESSLQASAALVTSSEDTPLKPDALVCLTGLKAAPHLNGLLGTCSRFVEETGRWSVLLGSRDVKDVKPTNLLTVISKPASTKQIAIVTGGNRGIGYFTAKKLVDAGLHVIVACRNQRFGRAAATEIGGEFELLDVDSDASITSFVRRFTSKYGYLDVLVNNAAVLGSPNESFAQRTEPTLRTNFFGLVALTDGLLPLLRATAAIRLAEGAEYMPRLTNITSERGRVRMLGTAAPVQARFFSDSLDRAGLFALVEAFKVDAKIGRHEQAGWGNSNYGFSKLAVTAYTYMVAREEGAALRANACHPGYCRTGMTGNLGDYVPEFGADAAIKCALLPRDGPTGAFCYEGTWTPW